MAESQILSFQSFDLFFAGASVFVLIYIALIVLVRKPIICVVIALIKSNLFLIYFWHFYDSGYSFIDDYTYLENGRKLYQQGVNILNFIQNYDALGNISGGHHIVYNLVNAEAIRFFGHYYFSPVALNVLISTLGSLLVYYIFKVNFQFSSQGSILILFSLCVEPSLLAWSTMINAKDILLYTLTNATILSFLLIYQKRYVTGSILIVILFIIFLYIRFYLPAIFLAAFVTNWLLAKPSYIGNTFIRLSFLGVIFAIILTIGPVQLLSLFQLFIDSASSPIFGSIKFLLTPIPFNSTDANSFMDLPQLVWWMSFPLFILGAIKLAKLNDPFLNFLLIYILFVCLFYGFLSDLQGPRQRVQLGGLLAFVTLFGLSKIRIDKRRFLLLKFNYEKI